MLSKHDIEIRRTKTLLDSDAQPEMYNEMGVLRIWGTFPIYRRLQDGEQRLQPLWARGPGGGAPSAQKFCYFFGKNN